VAGSAKLIGAFEFTGNVIRKLGRDACAQRGIMAPRNRGCRVTLKVPVRLVFVNAIEIEWALFVLFDRPVGADTPFGQIIVFAWSDGSIVTRDIVVLAIGITDRQKVVHRFGVHRKEVT